MYVESPTSESLVRRIRNLKDRCAWEQFAKTYGPLVYGYARRRGLQHADAAEVTQEVLCQVSQSIGSFDYQPQRGRFRGWLGAIARSKICQLQRRQRGVIQPKSQRALDVAASGNADAVWDEHFNQHILQLALRRIRPRFSKQTWRAFELAWIHDHPADCVAQMLSCDTSFVYVAKSRVLRRLREEVCELVQDSAIIS